MAGMLPGVECARRRRFHQGGGGSSDHHSPSVGVIGLTRRSSFCLYTSNHETHHTSVPSKQRSISTQTYHDDKLGGVAREAKERLDGRLRSQRKLQPKRQSMKGVDHEGELLNSEVYGSKKRFNWGKLSWKAMEQDECAICLERFKTGETLLYPPCAHRFHSRCLVPWLENNAHCPCCRMGLILS